MKVTIFVSIGLLTAALLLFGIVGCQRARTGPLGFHDNGYKSPQERAAYVKKWVSKKLDLTKDQQVELDRIFLTMAEKHEKIRLLRADLKKGLLDELRKEQVRPDALKALLDAKRPAFEEMIDLAAENLAAFHAMLTLEQREKLVAELESHSRYHGRCRLGQTD
jgi:hypothetical protein